MQMETAATIHRFKPVGWPRQFLLHLLSNLTSIKHSADRFLFNDILFRVESSSYIIRIDIR